MKNPTAPDSLGRLGWRALLRTARSAGACAAVLLAACDSGPSGPGVVGFEVEGTATLGAVVIEVTGLGIEGFVGQGDTEAYGAALPGTVATPPGAQKHRVVLVDRAGGLIQFGIRMEDVGVEPPVLSVVLATGVNNLPQTTGGILTRPAG